MMMLKLVVGFLLCQVMVEALKLPLTTHEPMNFKLLREGKFSELRELNHQKRQNALGRFSTVKSKISRYSHGSHRVQVGLGTPPQMFTFAINIADSATFVFDPTIQNFENQSLAGKTNCFYSNLSGTYIKDGRKSQDGLDLVESYYGIDALGLGDKEQLVFLNTTFSQVTKIETTVDYFDGHMDGSLGLSLAVVDDNYPDIESVIKKMLKSQLLDKQIFTIWVNGTGRIDQLPEGQVTFGDTDNEHCSNDIFYVPVTNKAFYAFKTNAIEIGNRKRSGTWDVFPDFEDPVTYLPPSVLKDVVKVTNAKFDFNAELYSVDCGVKFEFSFYVGNKKLTVDEKAAVTKVNNQCYLVFVVNQTYDEKTLTLGQAFTLKYCYVFKFFPDGNASIGLSENRD